MIIVPPVFDRVVAGNTVSTWLLTLLIAIAMLIAFALVQRVGLRLLSVFASRSKSRFDDIVASFLQRMPQGLWMLLAFLIALRVPVLPRPVDLVVEAGLLIICTSLVILLLQRIVSYLLLSRLPSLRAAEEENLPTVIQITIAIVLWCMGILLILSNLGINVLSLIAGLGIGGIAVALAVQNILGDIFSSYSLYLDQPFKEGDFIVVGEHMGIVKKIGLKTTRLQALQGEEIVISNQELTTVRVHNYRLMPKRRVVLQFGVTYDTPPASLKAIPDMVRSIIDTQENVTFDRAHFFAFGPSSLDFEIVFYMQTSDYAAYMDARQAIHLGILEAFEKEGIDFAFPTRTVRVVGVEN